MPWGLKHVVTPTARDATQIRVLGQGVTDKGQWIQINCQGKNSMYGVIAEDMEVSETAGMFR